MMYVVIALTALLASLLTFFSGFGLGTILLPVFGIFFPLPTAIALTAIVHFLNNIFKLGLTYKNINKEILIRFGIPSMIAAFFGATLLKLLTNIPVLFSYQISDHQFNVTILNLSLAFLMMVFALFEIIPFLKNLSFSKNHLISGGLLSGFFGGFSGHQGALRSAFLIRYSLEKTVFIATGVTIACMVDVTRLSVYGFTLSGEELMNNLPLLGIAIGSAFIGAYAGNKLVKKITISFIQKFVAVFLILIAILFGAGII